MLKHLGQRGELRPAADKTLSLNHLAHLHVKQVDASVSQEHLLPKQEGEVRHPRPPGNGGGRGLKEVDPQMARGQDEGLERLGHGLDQDVVLAFNVENPAAAARVHVLAGDM